MSKEYKEYIEREAAKARLRIWITDCVLDGDNDKANCFRDCIDLLDSIPAADVVEVVRCKDCKWYSELACGERELLGSQGWCNEVMARPMPSNGFCSFGERENNG